MQIRLFICNRENHFLMRTARSDQNRPAPVPNLVHSERSLPKYPGGSSSAVGFIFNHTIRKPTMLKEISIVALAIVAAWLLIALLPSLLEVGIGLMLLAGLLWLASTVCTCFKPRYREA